MIEKIRALIAQGEGLKVEFKEAQGGLPKNIYETICAFSNTQGGEILLGVADNGNILGINCDLLPQIEHDFANTISNISKVHPPLYLECKEVEIDDKVILYILVPASSEVHYAGGKVYIRTDDGDRDITHNHSQIAQLYVNKEKTYSENEIFPGITMDDLRVDLIERCRTMAVNRQPDHPWKDLNNEQLLRSAGLYKKDFNSQKEGYTLACALILGKDEVIQSILPHYKTDLILRVKDSERYDDRDDVRTNLIESYERIMAFVNKHLPSPFYMDTSDGIRRDLRNILFREISVNLLMHREFTNHYPAKLVIEHDRIYTENGNKPYICGNINPDTSTPYTKNPNIAKFFKEIGLAEELGSGIRKIAKYARIYAGYVPTLTDGEVFKLDWPINLFNTASDQVTDQVAESGRMAQSATQSQSVSPTSDTASDTVSDTPTDTVRDPVDSSAQQLPMNKILDLIDDEGRKVLELCERPLKTTEIMAIMKYSNKSYFLQNILYPLINLGVLEQTHPETPNHPNQKYQTVKRSRDE